MERTPHMEPPQRQIPPPATPARGRRHHCPLPATRHDSQTGTRRCLVCGATVYMMISRTPPRSRQKALFTATIVSPEGFERLIPTDSAARKCRRHDGMGIFGNVNIKSPVYISRFSGIYISDPQKPSRLGFLRAVNQTFAEISEHFGRNPV